MDCWKIHCLVRWLSLSYRASPTWGHRHRAVLVPKKFMASRASFPWWPPTFCWRCWSMWPQGSCAKPSLFKSPSSGISRFGAWRTLVNLVMAKGQISRDLRNQKRLWQWLVIINFRIHQNIIRTYKNPVLEYDIGLCWNSYQILSAFKSEYVRFGTTTHYNSKRCPKNGVTAGPPHLPFPAINVSMHPCSSNF